LNNKKCQPQSIAKCYNCRKIFTKDHRIGASNHLTFSNTFFKIMFFYKFLLKFTIRVRKEKKLHNFQSKIETIVILWRNFTEGNLAILAFSNMMFPMLWSLLCY